MDELMIITRQAPGVVTFDNFEEIKAWLAERLDGYKNLVYSEDSLKRAKADKADLNRLKKALDERRKEIKKIYMEPYLAIEAQIKELTAMIDEPLAEIKAFTDRMEEERKAQRRTEIKRYYDTVSTPLGELADLLFESEAFIDKKWLNASTKPKVWQDGVREKVAQASADLSTIQQTGGSQTPALISRYMESMDMAATTAYQKSLQETAAAAQTDVEAAVRERLSAPTAFETVFSRGDREHPYYRIYVGNYIIFYCVIGHVMELRRFIYKGRNWRIQI
nr:DUF1351 domain-containing protein [uncultured Ruminococcus sp.]